MGEWAGIQRDIHKGIISKGKLMKSFTHKPNNFIKLASVILICLFTFCSCSFEFTDLNYESYIGSGTDLIVHFLDVGQGDSIFAELPNSETMLIDAGVSGEGEEIISYINNLGYSEIDYLVATHPHADHIGSMAYVVENMDIESIYMPKAEATTRTYEKLLTAISEKGMKIQSASAGMNLIDGGNFTVDILGPVTIDEDNLNNSSVILKMTYGDNRFLFVGDAEKEELSTITSDMSADVLKVGHHGSNTSTTFDFLQEVNPSIAVISLGKDNYYGHPHQSTLELLSQFGVTTYRTDEDGTITIISDGNDITVETGGVSIRREN